MLQLQRPFSHPSPPNKKEEINSDDEHGHGQEKRNPSTLRLGKYDTSEWPQTIINVELDKILIVSPPKKTKKKNNNIKLRLVECLMVENMIFWKIVNFENVISCFGSVLANWMHVALV